MESHVFDYLLGRGENKQTDKNNKPVKREKGILQKLKDVFWTSDDHKDNIER